jgi:hypothetical protein
VEGEEPEEFAKRHLERFKYAARGRRGSTSREWTENEWWATGQHFGLATPLLDWTQSPYVAAYFAFEEARGATADRVVYGLDRDATQIRNNEMQEDEAPSSRPPVLELVDPLFDENPRLVTQGALFTRPPALVSVEDWVQIFFAESTAPVLIRLKIPNGERITALRELEYMNISHLSLFPDLIGASRATNLRAEYEPRGDE